MNALSRTLLVAVLLFGSTSHAAQAACGSRLWRVSLPLLFVGVGVAGTLAWQESPAWVERIRQYRAERVERARIAAEEEAAREKETLTADEARKAQAERDRLEVQRHNAKLQQEVEARAERNRLEALAYNAKVQQRAEAQERADLLNFVAPYVDRSGRPYATKKSVTMGDTVVFAIGEVLVFYDARTNEYRRTEISDRNPDNKLQSLFVMGGQLFGLYLESQKSGPGVTWLRFVPHDATSGYWLALSRDRERSVAVFGGRIFAFEPEARSIVEVRVAIPYSKESAVTYHTLGLTKVKEWKPLSNDQSTDWEVSFTDGKTTPLSELIKGK